MENVYLHTGNKTRRSQFVDKYQNSDLRLKLNRVINKQRCNAVISQCNTGIIIYVLYKYET